MAGTSEFSEEAIALAKYPPVELPPCESFCRFLLVERTALRRRWRCAICKRYISAPIQREHEITRKQILLTSVHVAGEPPDVEPIDEQPAAKPLDRQRDLFDDAG